MDEYERLWKMGSGGQGKVFRVRQKKSGKEYALKVVKCRDSQQANFALKEIKVLMELRHENIVTYVDFFIHFERSMTSEVSVCFVMELCATDLQEKIRDSKRHFMAHGRNQIDERTVLRWLVQSAQALQYIHERGFLHRDLKPTNVFFTSSNDVRLGDFGLATTTGMGRQSAVGTPYYFAPELMLRATYNNKVDIWGLGVVLLELLTLKERPINSEVLANPSAADSVVESITLFGYSKRLGQLVRDMLQRAPEARPSAASILKALGVDTGVERPLANVQKVEKVDPKPVAKAPAATVVPSAAVSGKPLCELCLATTAVVNCVECGGETYCAACDTMKHKNKKRSGHLRIAIATDVPVAVPVVTVAPEEVKVVMPEEAKQPAPEMRKPFIQQMNNIIRPKPPQQKLVAPAADAQQPVTLADLKAVAEAKPVCKAEPIVRTFHVPNDYPTIQLAIAAAMDGESVFVHSGTYTEPITLKKSITLTGNEFNPPTIEVTGATAVTICGGKGKMSNLRVRQVKVPHDDQKWHGVEVRDGAAWSITNCTISSQSSACIAVFNEGDPVVSNCRIEDGRQAGILIFDGGKGTYRKNEIKFNEHAGVLLKKNAQAKIIENTIADGRETGVFVCHNSQGLIEGNIITGHKGCGIVIKGGAEPIIRRNQISQNKQAGIFCCDRGSGTIADNEVSGNVKAGILIKTCGNPTVVRNRIYNGRETGVYVFESGVGVIEDNEIYGNLNAGILVTTGGNPTVRQNRIYKNQYEGVWVCKGGRGAFEGNDLRNNVKGARDVEDLAAINWISNIE